MIYVRVHKFENYRYKVIGYIIKRSKICIYIVFKYADCGEVYQATIFKCSARQKTQIVVWQNKAKRA